MEPCQWISLIWPDSGKKNENEKPTKIFESAKWKAAVETTDAIVVFCEQGCRLSYGWQEEIQACMSSNAAIAAVMPLCTNSRICKAQEDWLAGDGTFRFRNHALKAYPEITSADGCCLAVKSNCLRETGFLKEATFGSFADFQTGLCARLRQFGYQTRICDAVLAATPQQTPAQDEGGSRESDNEQMLDCIAENLQLMQLLNNGKKNLLFLVHRDFRKDAADHIGGTQMHVRDLTLALKEKYNVFVLARSRKDFLLTLYQGTQTLTFQIYCGGLTSPYPTLHNELERKMYAAVLDTLHIDLVHVHNLFELSFDMLEESKKRDIPLAFTVHDYYSLCPTAMMLDATDSLCLDTQTDEGCEKCLQQHLGIENGAAYMKLWRENFAAALQLCDTIFSPSATAEKVILNAYPQLKEKMQVLPHGVTLPNTKYRPEPDGKVLHVAFVGNVSKFKGSDMIYDLICKADPKKYQWSLLGGSAEAKLFFLKQSNYYKSDWYPRKKLPELIEKRKIDVVCLPSICSETYCYTLTEAAACGVPCVVSDVGALGERVRKSGAGWLMPAQSSAEQYLELLEKLRQDPEEILQKAAKTGLLSNRSVEQMAEDYSISYEKMIQNNCPVYEEPQQMWLYRAAYVGGAVAAPPPGEQAGTAARMRQAESRLAEIEHSRVYQAMLLMQRLLAPVSGTLLGLAGKILNLLRIKV